jgi:hypothetical protein
MSQRKEQKLWLFIEAHEWTQIIIKTKKTAQGRKEEDKKTKLKKCPVCFNRQY